MHPGRIWSSSSLLPSGSKGVWQTVPNSLSGVRIWIEKIHCQHLDLGLTHIFRACVFPHWSIPFNVSRESKLNCSRVGRRGSRGRDYRMKVFRPFWLDDITSHWVVSTRSQHKLSRDMLFLLQDICLWVVNFGLLIETILYTCSNLNN